MFDLNILDQNEEIYRTIKVNRSDTILASLLKNRVRVDHTCGGNATCGTCKFRLFDGEVAMRNNSKIKVLMDRGLSKDQYLSCQSFALSDIIIKID